MQLDIAPAQTCVVVVPANVINPHRLEMDQMTGLYIGYSTQYNIIIESHNVQRRAEIR